MVHRSFVFVLLASIFTVAHADPDCSESLTGWRRHLRRFRGAYTRTIFDRSPGVDLALAEEIHRRVRSREDQFVIPADVVTAWSREFGLSREDLALHFLPWVRETARPPSSEYMVGNVGLTKGGAIVVGNNLEFPPLPHVFSVHGETFLITLAYLRNLGPIRAIALDGGKACGHCRQFMFETAESNEMKILVPDRRPVPLPEYLHDAFDPGELGVEGKLLTPQHHAVELESGVDRGDELAARAAAEARRAYTPYSKRPAGVSMRTKDGRIFGGPYIEIVNYNASMDPAAAALVDLASHGVAYEDVTDVVLVELPSVNEDKDISFAETTRLIASARLKNAKVQTYFLRRTTSE